MKHENLKKLFDEVERRDKKALYDLGLMFTTGRYIDGLSIPKDEDEALYLITQSAKCGNSEAADWIYKFKPSLTDEEKEFAEGDKGDAYIRTLWSRVKVYNRQKRPVWRYKRAKKPPNPKLALVVLIAIIGVGCFWLYKGIFAIKDSFEVNYWVQTTGIITEAEVDTRLRFTLDEDGGDYYAIPQVSYTYLVDDREYTSNRITVLDGGYFTPFRSLANMKVRPYQPKGRKVSVYYDPINPARSVLKRGISFHTIVNIVLGGFFVSFIIYSIRRDRKKNITYF